MSEKSIIENFHKLYYDKKKDCPVWEKTFWQGIQILKCPLDLWVYQEIIFDLQPDFIIETGTWKGGSTLFLASICELINKGKIISIDKNKSNFPMHNRITYLTGSSIDEKITNYVKQTIHPTHHKTIVILDSDHHMEHVLKELEVYNQYVSKDSYLIVEDTNINGNPVLTDFGNGPMDAVKHFLDSHSEFIMDKEKEKFLMTFNPNGYLKRIT